MPKSNHRGVSYAGHRDITPDGVTEPEWVRVEHAPDRPAEQPEQPVRAPAPARARTRTRKRGA